MLVTRRNEYDEKPDAIAIFRLVRHKIPTTLCHYGPKKTCIYAVFRI